MIALFFILLGIIWHLDSLVVKYPCGGRQHCRRAFDRHLGFRHRLFAIGVAVVMNILLGSKTSYYQFTVGKNHVYVDEAVIQSYLREYWKELFVGQEIPNRITLKGNKINVVVDLPYVDPEQQTPLIDKIQRELTELFGDLLGYRQQFHLSLSFQSAPSDQEI